MSNGSQFGTVLILVLGLSRLAVAQEPPLSRSPIPGPAPAAIPLLLASGTTTPGDWLTITLQGAPPLRPTWLVWSHTPGLTVFDFGPQGILRLELHWPILAAPAPPTDASGCTAVAIPINPLLAPDYLHGLAVHFQLVTVEPGPTSGPAWWFHVSNAGQATDQYQEAIAWGALKAAAIADVHLAPGWSAPELLQGPVNTIGWEDSVAISADGQQLYFSYIPCDLMRWSAEDQKRIDRFNRHRRGPGRNVVPEISLNTLAATGSGNTFGPPSTVAVSLNTTPPWQSEVGLVPFGASVLYSADAPATGVDNDTDIFQDGVRLPFCTAAGENDPTRQGNALLFWSDDLGSPAGTKRIFQTLLSAGTWSTPVPLASPINLPDSDSWQPHLTATGSLYFTSNRGGLLGIWRSVRLGVNAWSTPVLVAWATPAGPAAAVGVAEPTLTADDQWLYFCVLFRSAEGSYDLDIACSHRLW